MKIVLATHNRHKVDEIKNIFSDSSLELLSLDNFPEIGEIIEDRMTLEENARKKARFVFDTIENSKSKIGNFISLADDTGLEVDALGGRPGVYSARYSGEKATYDENNRKLLLELKNIPPEQRTARFRCAISIIGKNIDKIAIGDMPGRILNEARGKNGFGYDPLFVPEGYERSYAEMDSNLKNKLSHRAKALGEVRRILKELTGLK
jgi:XTP/dITP diphosphohydrolase